MAKEKLIEERKKREKTFKKFQSYKETSNQINIQTINTSNKLDKQNKGDTYLKNNSSNIVDNNEIGKNLLDSEISDIIVVPQSNEFPVEEEEISIIGEENKYCCEVM